MRRMDESYNRKIARLLLVQAREQQNPRIAERLRGRALQYLRVATALDLEFFDDAPEVRCN